MKRKVYFIISSMILITMSALAIVNSDKLISDTIESFKDIPGSMSERVVNLYQNSGSIYISILSIVAIILNAVIIYWTLQDKLVKKKEKVIAFSIISFFTSLYSISQLVAIINVIVMAMTKRVNKEDFPDKKEELPVLKKENVTNKKIIVSIGLFVIYFSQFFINKLLPEESIISVLVPILYYVGLICLSILIFWDLLKENVKEFFKHFKAYYQNLLPMIGKYYLVYLGISLFAFAITGGNIAANQENVEELPLFILLPLAIIYAPIVEESLFRGSLRRFIKNDKVFVVVSAIIFGLLHTFSSEATLFNAIVMALPYASLGGFLAYIYTKTNNICCNMTLHALQNSLAMIITILVKGL